MLFALTATDKPNSLALRTATRQAHLDYVLRDDAVKLAGPLLDANGEMMGSLIVFEAVDADAARQWHAHDPYTKAGLFEHSEIRPWRASLNRCGANL